MQLLLSCTRCKLQNTIYTLNLMLFKSHQGNIFVHVYSNHDNFLSKDLKPICTVSGETFILNVLVRKDTVLKYWLGNGTITSEIGWSISYIIGQLHMGGRKFTKCRVCPCGSLSAFNSCWFVPLTH